MFKNEKFRNKSWYNIFWSKQPKAFGNPNTEISNAITSIYNKFIAVGVNHPKAIDIASGNGRYSLLLESIGFDTVAIDISEVACEILKNNLKEKAKSVKIICGDYLTSKDIENESFNFVFSSGLLEELTHDQQKIAIDKMKKMVKFSGFILVKYCLEIINRGKQVEDGFVESQFDIKDWKIISKWENKEMKKYPQGITGEDFIRTGMFYAENIKKHD